MFLCSLLTFAQFSGTVSDSQGVRYTANNDALTCYVSGHESSYNSEIIIPEVYEGRTVTGIGSSAFLYCSSLASVVIPNSVTSIGDYAFRGCSGLTGRLEIPNSVTSIEYAAFSGCSGLSSVTIGNSVTTIGHAAFWNCSGLASVTIGNSVTSIGGGAFAQCSSLEKVIVQDLASWCNIIFGDRDANPLNYAHHLFSDENTEIMDLVIPNSVTSIGIGAFAGCSGLTSVEIPNSVTSIEDDAFSECSGLTSVTIPNSVTRIGDRAFGNCSGLTSVEIGNGVTNIGREAFARCTGLTSVEIPNSVTSIGDGAFADCSSLTSMVVSSGNTTYDSRDNCNAIIETATNTLISGCKNTVIPNSVTSFGEFAFYGCSSLTMVEIPNSVTSIGDYTYAYCTGLTSVTIPNSVTTIGHAAFWNCSGLTSVEIGNGVTRIGGSAFHDCSGLISMEIPNSVTSIGSFAFDGTAWYINQPDGLVYAGKVAYKYKGTMPDNTHITLLDGTLGIADRAFFDCSGLTSVEIPNSVTIIGVDAFWYCNRLTSVTAKNETPVEIESETFSNRANATLYVPAGSKEAYEAANYWKDFKEIIEMDIQPIDTGETVDFGSDIDGDTDLDGNIVGDIYYVISNDDGGYDVAEGCIVVTTPTDDSTIDGQDIFGEDFQAGFTGIVLKVPAGRGTITVEAQTIGTMVLKVKIGTAAPVTMELDGRLKVSFPYDVTEPTYVYIYGGSNASAAPDMAGSAAGGELKLYGIEVAPGATGIEPTPAPSPREGKWYTLDGRCIANGQWKMDNGQLPKGVYIVNGHKVVIK